MRGLEVREGKKRKVLKRREEEAIRTKAKSMYRVPRIVMLITMAILKRKRAMIKRTHLKKCPKSKNGARMITRPRLEIIIEKNEL